MQGKLGLPKDQYATPAWCKRPSRPASASNGWTARIRDLVNAILVALSEVGLGKLGSRELIAGCARNRLMMCCLLLRPMPSLFQAASRTPPSASSDAGSSSSSSNICWGGNSGATAGSSCCDAVLVGHSGPLSCLSIASLPAAASCNRNSLVTMPGAAAGAATQQVLVLTGAEDGRVGVWDLDGTCHCLVGQQGQHQQQQGQHEQQQQQWPEGRGGRRACLVSVGLALRGGVPTVVSGERMSMFCCCLLVGHVSSIGGLCLTKCVLYGCVVCFMGVSEVFIRNCQVCPYGVVKCGWHGGCAAKIST